MQADNEILFDGRNRRFRLIREEDFGKAVFEGNARGFGFLVRDDGDDLFVPMHKTNGAFHKDTVLYRRVDGTVDEARKARCCRAGLQRL